MHRAGIAAPHCGGAACPRWLRPAFQASWLDPWAGNLLMVAYCGVQACSSSPSSVYPAASQPASQLAALLGGGLLKASPKGGGTAALGAVGFQADWGRATDSSGRSRAAGRQAGRHGELCCRGGKGGKAGRGGPLVVATVAYYPAFAQRSARASAHHWRPCPAVPLPPALYLHPHGLGCPACRVTPPKGAPVQARTATKAWHALYASDAAGQARTLGISGAVGGVWGGWVKGRQQGRGETNVHRPVPLLPGWARGTPACF